MHPQSPALRALAEKWDAVPAAERANFHTYATELCDALGVERPEPRGSGYEFEYPVTTTDRRTGKDTTNYIDLYRRDHFILEAKHTDAGAGAERVLGAAYGQAKGYAGDVAHGPPPYLMVMNIARSLLVWDRWSGNYGGVNAARRIDLRTLWQRDDEIEFLRTLWEDPESLNPAVRGRVVTREVAERLARLSASLEARGIEGERVARFLMRCVFTMFAEDVGLLADKPFQTAIHDFQDDPDEFAEVMTELWKAMDAGTRFGLRKLLRFNGHFFADSEALPLDRGDMAVLADAARADWRQVEPTIFGTLLTRALDPKERHRLGAEYTPREYVERVVRQTVDVPLRQWWAPVQASVVQRLEEADALLERAAALRLTGAHALDAERDRTRKARERAFRQVQRIEGQATRIRAEAERDLRGFHSRIRALQFLDPACGSGNFLYVTLHIVKRVELEVIRAIEAITGLPELGLDEVKPDQFHGIEVKPWAREIAELTLWIGYHQFWMEHHKGVNPPEPVLKDTGTLELRDAVLAWDEIVEVPEKSRPDPTPRIVHPVTGELVPDPDARLVYRMYTNPRPAPWPQADFIIANPPYLGQSRMREEHGDGYVDALRSAYAELPDNADFVMYWWHRAAELIAAGRAIRAGFITTQSITQAQNRRIVALAAEKGARVMWAIADHAWCDGATGAEVRVTMTVLAKDPPEATLVEVQYTRYIVGETAPPVIAEKRVPRLNLDLSAHADVPRAASVRLKANQAIATRGVELHGQGFLLSESEAADLIRLDPSNSDRIKSYWGVPDLIARPRNLHVIDFALESEPVAREYPLLYDRLRDLVQPHRAANPVESRRTAWWRLGLPGKELRSMLFGLSRFIVTPVTARHRMFTFLDCEGLPDQGLFSIALADALHLGVLSSRIHLAWALAAGGALEDKARYNKKVCFDPFPFPDPPKHLRERIGLVAEAVDQHRKDAIARDERVTMTRMYNVVEKLRSGEALTPRERTVHEIAACGVLRDLHDELDRLVAEAYGWPWPMEREQVLERLVALHDERVEEEKRGIVRWLRPEYQIPRFGGGVAQVEEPELGLPEAPARAAPEHEARPWPAGAIEQIAAVKAQVTGAAATAEEVADAFAAAPVRLVARHLETLAMVGEVRQLPEGRYQSVAEPL